MLESEYEHIKMIVETLSPTDLKDVIYFVREKSMAVKAQNYSIAAFFRDKEKDIYIKYDKLPSLMYGKYPYIDESLYKEYLIIRRDELITEILK